MTRNLGIVFFSLALATGGLAAGCLGDASEYGGCAPQNPECSGGSNGLGGVGSGGSGGTAPLSTATVPAGDPCTATAVGSFFDDFECPKWSRYDGPCVDVDTTMGTIAVDDAHPGSPQRTRALSSAIPASVGGPRMEACLLKRVRVEGRPNLDVQLEVFVDAGDASLFGDPWAGHVLSVAVADDDGATWTFAVGVGYIRVGPRVSGPSWTLVSSPDGAIPATTGVVGTRAPVGRWAHIDLSIRSEGVVLLVDGEVAATIQGPAPGLPAKATHLDLRTGLMGLDAGVAGPMHVHIDDVQLRTVP